MAINEVNVSPRVESADAEEDLQGSLWQHDYDGTYLMAQTAVGENQLISLLDGNRWSEPQFHDGNPFGGERHDFTRIPPGSTVSIVVGED